MTIEYKILSINDVVDYKNIRLDLLKQNPTNFGSSFEEESMFDESVWQKRLSNPNATSIGVYNETQIIGLCVVVKNPRLKMKHKAHLNSMYVRDEFRRRGISKNLLNYVFEFLKDTDVEILCLSVVSENCNAISLYKKVGFIEDGMEQKAIKYKGKYYNLILMSKHL